MNNNPTTIEHYRAIYLGPTRHGEIIQGAIIDWWGGYAELPEDWRQLDCMTADDMEALRRASNA